MESPDLGQVADSFRRQIPDMENELARMVQSIPSGQVVTYGDIATALGDPIASRWVAAYLLDPTGKLASWSHRVLRSTGEVGKYCSDDPNEKSRKLNAEGITVSNDRIDLEVFRWQLPPSTHPLALLQTWQRNFAIPEADRIQPEQIATIGGIDISYAGEVAVAVCSCFVADGKTFLDNSQQASPTCFPYISGYLAFREIPVYLELLAKMQVQGKLPDILLVDGNGRLHPRQMGVATMLGALTGIPTIGVAKKQLCGTLSAKALQVGQWQPIFASADRPDAIIGYALLPHAKTKNPIFVSTGFAIEDQAMQQVVSRCLAGHRSPEPIFQADRDSRQIASTL